MSSAIQPPISSPTHTPTPGSDDAPNNALPATGSNLLSIDTCNPSPQPLDASPADAHPGPTMESSDWYVLMSLDTVPALAMAKTDYIDFSEVSPMFKTAKAIRNKHKLDPMSIPNALRQMAYYRVFIPLSMLTADSMNTIRDNVGDLYTKKKTGLSVGKYILNSDVFPGEDTLSKQTFF